MEVNENVLNYLPVVQCFMLCNLFTLLNLFHHFWDEDSVTHHQNLDAVIYFSLSPLHRASLIAQLVKNPPAMQDTLVWFLGGLGRSAGEEIGYPLQYSWASLVAQVACFQGDTIGKKSACQYRRGKWCRFDPSVSKIPWTRKWQPTVVFLPAKFHGQRSPVGYRPWSHRESKITEHAHTPWHQIT